MISPSSEDVATVVSILPIAINEDKPLIPSNYKIKAVLDTDREVETLMIRRGSFRVYIDESRPALIIPEPADIIAGAICRDFKVASSYMQPGVAEPGLFWVRGGYGKDEILEAAEVREELNATRRKQTEWFKLMVAGADDDWAKYRVRRMISDLQRLACKCLGIERPWDIELEVTKAIKMITCKFCREEIHPEAIICKFCRGVVDMERYKMDYVSANPTA